MEEGRLPAFRGMGSGVKYYSTGWQLRICASLMVGAMCLSLAGCSSNDSAPDATPKVHSPVLLKSVDLHLPVESYLFSDAETEELSKARFALHKKCLQRFGLNYEIPPAGPSVGPRSFMDRRYGVTDKAEAEADGYHLGDRDPRKHPAHPPRLSGDQQKALMGRSQEEASTAADGGSALRVNGVAVPPGGCSAEAAKELAGSAKLGPGDLPRQVNFDSFASSKSDSRVRKAFEAWSGCMKRHGYSYPDPLGAVNDPRFQGASSTQQERSTATADVACKKQVNLVGIWFTVETSLQKEMIARRQADFAAALKAKDKQLARVKAVLRDQ
ncbi:MULTISPECIES: hypothetical protein [Streptomyces]|uniref:hypothetical protein n=1 Tax=Streptomyces TaxID=1883 RepID=UPI0004CD4CCA|nr:MULTISPECIES: hypothetical protein [Streptomyces]KOT47715.1 hypothetical protein ADK43_39560 [Streptomyces rimosus subsp. rimosus]